MPRRRGAEMAVQDERADPLRPPAASGKNRTPRDGNPRILEVIDNPLGPALGEADAVIEKREDPAARLCRGVVETVTPRGGVVRNHGHAFRSTRPGISRRDDELAR